MLAKYHYKIQSRLQKSSIYVLFIFLVLNLLISKRIHSWGFTVIALTILPSFLTYNIISEVYEYTREGIVFTTKTPIYEQLIKRFMLRWGVGVGIITIIYTIGYMKGFEDDFFIYFVIILYATFLSLLGVTFSNLLKNSVMGVAIILIFWGSSLFTTIFVNKDLLWPISVSLNLQVRENIFWNNLISISAMIVLLIIFNLWYVSKGEKARLLLGIISLVLIGTSSSYLIINQVKYFKGYTIQSSVVNNNSDLLYVVLSQDREVKEYFSKRNIDYITSINNKKIKQNNVIIIKDRDQNCRYFNEEEIKVTEQGVQIGKITVDQANAYKIIKRNPINNKKNMIIMESNNWTEKQIKSLVNQNKGNLLVVKDDKSYAKIDYIDNFNMKDIESKITVFDTQGWLKIKTNSVKVKYRNLTIDQAKYIGELWEVVHKELEKIFKSKISNTIQVCYKKDKVNVTYDIPTHKLISIKDFDKADVAGRSLLFNMSISVIRNYILKNIKDNEIRESLSKFITRTKIFEQVKENLPEAYITKNYFMDDDRNNMQEYLESIKNSYEHVDLEVLGKNRIYIDYIFYYLDQKGFDLCNNDMYFDKKEISVYELKNLTSKKLKDDKLVELWNNYIKEKNKEINSSSSSRIKKRYQK